jgi:multisubunit Na+/H+ antiporter MnhG subunit
MTLLDKLSAALIIVGAIFFLAGTIGLLRFPDTRLDSRQNAKKEA